MHDLFLTLSDGRSNDGTCEGGFTSHTCEDERVGLLT